MSENPPVNSDDTADYEDDFCPQGSHKVVSYAAVIWVVTQRSSPTNN